MSVENLDIHKQLAMAKLPSLPQVLLELMALCERDDVALSEIASTVAKDAGVASRVVTAANSPYYRPRRPLETLDQCLALLGMSTVRRLALNQSVAELFGRFQKNNRYDLRGFWLHGLSVAVTARRLARHLGYPNPEEAYLAGLLHDVGQLALLAIAADRYLPLFMQFKGEHELMRQEQAAFGVTHAEVGAWLAERWNLRSLFVDSILYHHEPISRVKDAHVLVQIVMLANLFNATSETEMVAHEEDLPFWKLDTGQVMAMLESAQEEVAVIAAELGIELPASDDPVPAPAQDAALARLADTVSQHMDGLLAQPEPHAADARDEAVVELLRASSLLFGGRDCALFLPEGDMLCWHGLPPPDTGDERAGEIRIDRHGDASCIARAFHGRIGLSGQTSATSNLEDAQVLRQLGGERLLCLPLTFEGESLGTLAIGLDLPMVERLAKGQSLLVTFAREAGKRLGPALRLQNQVEAARQDGASQAQRSARKLVHEAANPLGVVRNYLAMLRQQLADQSQAQDDIQLIEGELRRVSRILLQMRQTGPTPETGGGGDGARVDINTLVQDVIRFCQLGKQELERIQVGFSPTPDLPLVAVEPDKLKQVLTNLIFNAAEAMQGEGRIDLATSWWRTGTDSETLEIAVGDNGPGLPSEVLDQLYQPVPTSKGETHSGLGLSIVSGLVRDLGGAMQCNSGPDGTHFKIHLPMIRQAA